MRRAVCGVRIRASLQAVHKGVSDDATARWASSYVPYQIDGASGVIVQITVMELDADGRPDILTASKLGMYLFLKRPTEEQSGFATPVARVMAAAQGTPPCYGNELVLSLFSRFPWTTGSLFRISWVWDSA
jgi:hypothetical protein